MKVLFERKIFGYHIKIWQETPPPFNVPKKKKQKKRGIYYCDVTTKVIYTEALAKLKAKQHKKRGNYIRAYCCEYCNKWHLTHKKRKKM